MQRTMLVAGFIVIGLLTFRTTSVSVAQPPGPQVDPKIVAFMKPVEAAGGDGELQKKLKERHNIAVQLLEARVNEYKKGVRDVSGVFEAARFVAEAKVDLADSRQAKAAVLEQVIEIAKVLENQLGEQLKKGFGSKSDLERARLARVTAEVELLRAQGK